MKTVAWFCRKGCPTDQGGGGCGLLQCGCQCHEDNFVRTSGDMVCEICSKEYRKHAHDEKATYLRRLCDGRLVKL